MKLVEVTNPDTIKSEIDNITVKLEELINYNWVEITEEEKVKQINKIRSRLGIYLIRCNTELNNIFEELGVNFG